MWDIQQISLKLFQKKNPESILVSFDVTSLYSNIPLDLGLTAIKCWIDKYPDLLHERFSKDFVLKFLQFILKNNFMHLNDNVYRQILGTTIRTKVAPTYATLFLGFLEEKLFETYEEKFDQHFGNYYYIRKSWRRYLNDCFIIHLEREKIN